MRQVGYYVHHQGAGHWQRACAIAFRLYRPCTLIGTLSSDDAEGAPVPTLRLPDDRLDDGFASDDGDPERPLAMHYAPLGHPGILARMAAIAGWAAEFDPVLMIVDVSVEIALLARLLSIPTIVVRLAGHRTDPAHLEAFRSAEALVAPFPETLEASDTPDWVAAKTLYAGLLDPEMVGRTPVSASDVDGRIVVVLGRGGGNGNVADLVAAAGAVPERDWHVIGHVDSTAGAALPENLHLHGWVANAAEHVARAAVVVGAAGDGVVGLAASRGCPFVCIPEPRAYDEQIVKARALAACHAAVVREAWPTDWPSVIAEVAAIDPAILAGLVRPDGIGWLTDRIEEIAARIEARSRSEHPVVR